MPSLADILAQQRATFAGYDLDYPRPTTGDDYAAAANQRYAIAWRQLARKLDAAGDQVAARAAAQIAAQLEPE